MRVVVFMVAVMWAACTVAACGTERQASPSSGQSAGSTAAPVSLTVASNGTTVRLSRGQSVSVLLGGTGLSWHVPAATGGAVRRTNAGGGYPGRQPARATFLASRPGRAILSSVTDAACLHARPSCAVAQQAWRVVVIVTGAHS